jgi:murein peptide amidase A
MTSHHLRSLVLGVLAVGLAGLAGPAGSAAADDDPARTLPDPYYSELEVEQTVIGTKRIGTSVDDRPIRAYHLGNPEARTTAVVLGSMHGNEKAGLSVVDALRDGKPVKGVDLWVVPTINPDGVAANTRGNAHGVDLNRNFRHNWAPLTGSYYSGPKPFSEPESRALKRFLDRVDPTFVVSFHQPLYGVGRAGERRPFLRRLSKGLDLPIKAFNCTGECHGTMTSWFNHNHGGTAVTVEFGSSPSRAYLRGKAAAGTLAAVLGRH